MAYYQDNSLAPKTAHAIIKRENSNTQINIKDF